MSNTKLRDVAASIVAKANDDANQANDTANEQPFDRPSTM
jgi:hypothetical protein